MKLTEEQIEEAFQQAADADEETHIRFARAIEAEVLRLNGIDGRGEAVAWIGKMDFESLKSRGRVTATLYNEPVGDASNEVALFAPPQQQQAAPSHASDCATNNAPAYQPGPCDCLPTPEMCRAAVEYMNGADVYEKVPPGVTEIEEGIYREVYLAMQRKAPQQAEPVPDGFVLVPVEPTKEMIEAARWEDGEHTARAVYAAMLSAAPKVG